MHLAVLASEGTTQVGTMEAIMKGVVDAIEFSGTIVNHLVANPIYLFLLASGFIGVGASIFAILRRAATGRM